MNRFLLLSGLLLLVHPAAANHPMNAPQATTPSVAQVRARLAAMPRGDVQRGQTLNQTHLCASCHGNDGVAPTGNWTSLAGQRAAYTWKSLLDYQQGGRHEHGRATLMTVSVQGLSRQDMADLAAYYASLPAVATPAPKLDATTRKQVEKLIRHGDPTRLITPCASCHGAAGQGGINETPALAGQTVGGFLRTMNDYRDGRRITDANQGMRQFAQRLTEEEINNLAAYYAGLGRR
jgi:cytochrome c553